MYTKKRRCPLRGFIELVTIPGHNPMMEPAAILAAIEALDPYERRQFQAAYSQLGVDKRNLSREAQYVANGLVEITRRHHRVAEYRDWKIDSRTAEIYAYLGDQIEGLAEPQIEGLILLCLKALAALLKAEKRPVSAATLLDRIGDLGLAMDRAFPGYWSSRLLYRLVRPAELMA